LSYAIIECRHEESIYNGGGEMMIRVTSFKFAPSNETQGPMFTIKGTCKLNLTSPQKFACKLKLDGSDMKYEQILGPCLSPETDPDLWGELVVALSKFPSMPPCPLGHEAEYNRLATLYLGRVGQ